MGGFLFHSERCANRIGPALVRAWRRTTSCCSTWIPPGNRAAGLSVLFRFQDDDGRAFAGDKAIPLFIKGTRGRFGRIIPGGKRAQGIEAGHDEWTNSRLRPTRNRTLAASLQATVRLDWQSQGEADPAVLLLLPK